MPKYFSTNRLASFQRQLNLYGFIRINEGRFRGGYHHEFFQKGKRHLCRKIKRQKTRPSRQSLTSGGSTSATSLEARAGAEILAGSPQQVLSSRLHQDQLAGGVGNISSSAFLGHPGLNAQLGIAGLLDSTGAAGASTMRNLAPTNPFRRSSLLSMARESEQLSAVIAQQRQRQSAATQQQIDNLLLFARLNQSRLRERGSQQRPNFDRANSEADAGNEGKSDPR